MTLIDGCVIGIFEMGFVYIALLMYRTGNRIFFPAMFLGVFIFLLPHAALLLPNDTSISHLVFQIISIIFIFPNLFVLHQNVAYLG